MWKYIIRFILRYRLLVLISMIVLTAFMGFQASRVKMSYEMANMLPANDSTSITYKKFQKHFSRDASMMMIGLRDQRVNTLETFNAWRDLTIDLQDIEGVQATLSIGNTYQLVKDEEVKQFKLVPIVNEDPSSQEELDSLLEIIYTQKFYDKLMFNKDNGFSLMTVTMDKKTVNSKNRFVLMDEILSRSQKFQEETGVDLHYSGLPYIRSITSEKIKFEIILFSFLTMLIASIALFVFFRSMKAVFFPMIIVSFSVIWALGLVALFGYEISVVTSILPPLSIIIAVENCIFLLNKYYFEFKNHKNKVKSLSRMIQRVGTAMFLTNLTTAVGFLAFTVTRNQMLVEFGIVASITIAMIFILSLSMIPIFFSYINPPKDRHTKYLDNKFTNRIVSKIEGIISNKRSITYTITTFIVLAGFVGLTFLKTTGNIVDDIPKDDSMYQDLLFFEEEVNGILPFEIMIDTKKKKGITKLSTLKKINKLQDTLATYPQFSRALSIAEIIKTAKQAFYNGDPEKYTLIKGNEKAFILQYLPEFKSDKKTILNTFVDTGLQITRVSVQIRNIGTHTIDSIKNDLRPKIDSIFNPKKYDVEMTGTSVVFLQGTNYLVDNLLISLLLALIVITFLLSLMFRSPQVVLISLIPNLIPQILTAALMGYLGIPIKPSTILIFSIALGISVDNTIHYLSRFRMELKNNGADIKKAVFAALAETAHSMLYSSIILFLGFSVFMLSSFGGTESLGKLITFTLIIAMISNLIILPSLLLTMDKRWVMGTFQRPFLRVIHEPAPDDDDEPILQQ